MIVLVGASSVGWWVVGGGWLEQSSGVLIGVRENLGKDRRAQLLARAPIYLSELPSKLLSSIGQAKSYYLFNNKREYQISLNS